MPFAGRSGSVCGSAASLDSPRCEKRSVSGGAGAGGADVGADAGAAIGAGGTDAGTDAGAIGVETDTDPDCPWVAGVYLAIRVAAFPGRATPATTRGPLLAKPKERAGVGAGVAEMGAGAGVDADADPDADADAGTNAGTVLVAELSGIGVGT